MASSAAEGRPDGVCLTCGRADCTIEEHHPAGRYNVAEITIPECTPGCHEVLTERQLAAGVKLARRLDRSEAEREWSLLQGVSDTVALLARNRGLGEVAGALDEGGPALGRLLSALAPGEWTSRTGAAGDVGPDPRCSDRRRGFRERRGEPLPTVSGDSVAPDGADELTRSEDLVGLLAETEQRFFDEDTLARIDLPGLLTRLGELAERGVLDRFVEWGRQKAPDLAAAATALGSAGPEDTDRVLQETEWMARMAHDVTAGLARIAGGDESHPETVLAALMEAWPAPIPSGR